jgi:hypothetical protein
MRRKQNTDRVPRDGRRTNHACSNGLLAASAKNGSPIVTANNPNSQSAYPLSGGLDQDSPIASGNVNRAMINSVR